MEFDTNYFTDVHNYFEKIVSMIPGNKLKKKTTERKRKSRNKKCSDAKTPPKKTKLTPHHLKAIQEMNKYMSEDDDSDDKFKHKNWFADKPQYTVEELHNRLQKKIEEVRLKREKATAKKVRTRNSKNFLNSGEKKKSMPSVTIEKEFQKEKPVVEKSQNNTDALLTKEGKVVFSKFDFGQMVGSMSGTKSSKSKKQKLPTGKNYELLLLKANREKERIEKLKQEDPKKAEQVIEKKSWDKAVAKAEGTKIKDDPELLKKSLKRKLAKKKQSAKQWQERNEKLQEKMQKKQDRRNSNLQKRKEHKKNKKALKRAKKMPGF